MVVVAGVDKQVKFLAGDLVDLRNKVGKTPEGKEIESASAVLFDRVADEAYFLTIGQTYLGRNILNSLLALKTFGGVEIGLYTSKPKPGKDKGFKSAAVRQNQQLIYGKFKNEELPKIVKVQVGKEIHSDQVAINAHFTAQVEEFGKVIRAANPVASVASGATVTHDDSHPEEPDAVGLGDPTVDEGEPTLPNGKKLLF